MSADVLDMQVISGISLGFTLIFFAPLALVALGFLVYCGFARGSVLRAARVLSVLWLLACLPAALLIVMGSAFSPGKGNPLLVVPLWVVAGLAALWLPVALRRLFRIRPL